MSAVRSGSWHARQEPAALLDWIYGTVAGAQGVTGVSRDAADSIQVRSEARPAWSVLVAVILFPIGLLALMAKNQMLMMVRVTPDPAGGCQVSVTGAGSPGLVKAITHIYNSTTAAPAQAA